MNTDDSKQDEPARETAVSPSRRRLLRTGAGVAPVLLTVASKPVLGQTVCTAASAMGSAGSQAQRTAAICSGLTPAQWKQRAAMWPTPYCASDKGYLQQQATLYHCPTTGFSGHVFGDRTMLEVLDIGESGTGPRGLGRYMVAALLNACSGRTPVLTETGVRMMWNDLITRGYYEPTAGVQWQTPQIIAYLNTTMG